MKFQKLRQRKIYLLGGPVAASPKSEHEHAVSSGSAIWVHTSRLSLGVIMSAELVNALINQIHNLDQVKLIKTEKRQNPFPFRTGRHTLSNATNSEMTKGKNTTTASIATIKWLGNGQEQLRRKFLACFTPFCRDNFGENSTNSLFCSRC